MSLLSKNEQTGIPTDQAVSIQQRHSSQTEDVQQVVLALLIAAICPQEGVGEAGGEAIEDKISGGTLEGLSDRGVTHVSPSGCSGFPVSHRR